MRIENNLVVAAAGVLLLASSVANAGSIFSIFTEQISVGATPEMSQTLALEKMIQKNTEKKLTAEADRYTQIVTLAGDRKGELATRKNAVVAAYKAWQNSKSAVELSRNADAHSFRAVEIAAQEYSRANKEFIDLQKTILAKNKATLDTVDAFNTAPPTASGSR